MRTTIHDTGRDRTRDAFDDGLDTFDLAVYEGIYDGVYDELDGDTGAAPEPVAAAPGRRPALDLTKVVTTGEVVLGAVVIAERFARRPPAVHADVTMGPGGWVSMKGGTVAVRKGSRPWARPRRVTPAPPDGEAARVPLWARVISAVPLQWFMR